MAIQSTKKEMQRLGLLPTDPDKEQARIPRKPYPTDYLQEMLDQQERSQYDRGYNFDEMTVHERVDYIKLMTLYMQTEMCEFLQELPFFKEWKVYKEATEVLTPEGREELMDVIHFMLNILLACGMTSESIFEGYMRKQKINQERLNDTEHYRKDKQNENRSDATDNSSKVTLF